MPHLADRRSSARGLLDGMAWSGCDPMAGGGLVEFPIAGFGSPIGSDLKSSETAILLLG